jgi:hypothetical protein
MRTPMVPIGFRKRGGTIQSVTIRSVLSNAMLRTVIVVDLLVVSCPGCSGASGSRQQDADATTGVTISSPDANASCLGSSVGAPGLDGGAVDPLCVTDQPAVSFATDIAPILAGCTGEVCHAAWTYSTLVGQKSTACCDHRWLMEPGQPSSSHVIQAITGIGACVPSMPLGGGRLPDVSVAALIAWVCQGALDN